MKHVPAACDDITARLHTDAASALSTLNSLHLWVPGEADETQRTESAVYLQGIRHDEISDGAYLI